MDEWHPDILLQHAIQPEDYKSSLVFRSAVESIRGTFIASSTVRREQLVSRILQALRQNGKIADYDQTGRSNRYDFTVAIQKNPDYFSCIEVKGGEGNSINISERPLWAREFAVWCHLDGAIVNQPANGAHSIINRLTNELVRRQKQVDVLFFKDLLCGTPARPCPKYPGQEATITQNTAPDIFLFPQRVPSQDDPEPPIHTLKTLRLPKLILELFDISSNRHHKHIWNVHVKLLQLERGKLRREVKVVHQGTIVDSSLSRSWQP